MMLRGLAPSDSRDPEHMGRRARQYAATEHCAHELCMPAVPFLFPVDDPASVLQQLLHLPRICSTTIYGKKNTVKIANACDV